MTRPRVWFIVLLLALVATVSQAGAPHAASAVPDHVALSWIANPATTQTITWRTDDTVACGRVQYQAGPELRAPKQVEATPRAFETDLQATRLFTVTLTGLSPATKYTYRVGDGTHWSAPHSFTTANPKATRVEFLVFGDSQSNPNPGYLEWGKTVEHAARAYPAAKFMVNMGDLVDIGQSGAHWNAWFAAAAEVLDRLPEMPVVGNHEWMGAGKGPAGPHYFRAQFALPQNGPEGLKGEAYSFDYGPVHCVMLDTQTKLEEQATWLGRDLAASHAPWKIVFLHKPPYPAQPLRLNQAVKSAFCPIFDRYHVDLVFMAHDHAVARSYPINHDRLVAQPSRGTVYYMTGRSGIKTYEVNFKQPYHAYFHNPLSQPNYLVVEANGSRLTVKAVNQDGTLLDTYGIDRETDVTSDGAPPSDLSPKS